MSKDYPEGLGPNDPVAPDRAHTDHSRVSFTIKEYSHGEPWVIFEDTEPGLPVLKAGNAFLGLDFRPEIPFQEAEQFVREMRRMFDTISYTKFDT